MDDYANRGTAAERAEMRIEQMDPESDLKLWGNDGPTRKWLYNHMTEEERAAWQKQVDPRLAEMEKLNPQPPPPAVPGHPIPGQGGPSSIVDSKPGTGGTTTPTTPKPKPSPTFAGGGFGGRLRDRIRN